MDAKLPKLLGRRDPEFKDAWLLGAAHLWGEKYEDAKRPVGVYRADGVFRLSAELRVHMRNATREDLIAWALHESAERNLDYIRTRLDLFAAHPECRTLAELETADGN